MKKTTLILGALFMMLNISVFSQTGGVVISNGTATADPSAMLDVQSTTKGMLVPRMTESEKNAITPVATGLMIFQTDGTAGFYYYDGTAWKSIGAGVLGINDLTDGATGDQNIFLGGNVGSANTTGSFNVAIGYAAFADNSTGGQNTATGGWALKVNTTGISNTANGTLALQANTAGSANTAIGASALNDNTTGTNNTATGYNALRANTTVSYLVAYGYAALSNNTSGNSNTANGAFALGENTTASGNTATGYITLGKNTIGGNNTGFGAYTLGENIEGNENTATGYTALNLNTTGNQNTANGAGALHANTTGDVNTATGYRALYTNIAGNNNTAMGNWALYTATGSKNTAFGAEALTMGTTGEHNTAIGYYAYREGTHSNSTAVGYGTVISDDNQIRLGNNSVSSIGGQVGWTTVSDGRFKTNLKENVAGLDFIMKLRPLTYHFDMDAIARFNKTPDSLRLAESEQLLTETVQIGFIAQEVEEAATELGFDFHGVDKPQNEDSHYGLRYAEFVVPLVKAVQEQQAIIENQQDLLSKYESTLEEMNNRMEMLEAKVSGQHSEKYVEVK